MADKEIDVKVRVDQTGVKGALSELENSISHTTSYLRTNFLGIGNIVERIKIPLASLGATLAAAFAVKEIEQFVAKAEELGVELERAHQKTGIAVDALAGLKFSAEQTGTSFESLTRGTNLLAKTLEAAAVGKVTPGAEALKALGISATDAEGKIKPFETVIAELAGKFSNMEDGPNKLALALAILGRGGADWIPVLNQGSAALKAQQEEVKSMNAVMDPEVAAKYHEATGRLNLVWQSLAVTVGQAVMPALTDLLNAMADSAREGGTLHDVIHGLGVAFDVVVLSIKLIVAAIEQVFAVGMFVFNTLNDFIGGVGAAIHHVVTGQFSAAREDMKVTEAKMSADFKSMTDTMVNSATSVSNAMNHIFGSFGDVTGGSSTPKTEGPTFGGKPGGGGAESSELPKWREQWLTIKEGFGAFVGDMKEKELEFWQAKLAIAGKGSKDYLAVHHMIVALQQAIQKEQFADQIAAFKLEEEAANGNAEKIVQIRTKELAAVRARYAETSKEVQAALRDLGKAEQAHVIQATKAADDLIAMERDHALASVALEQESINIKRQMGDISAVTAVERTRQLMEREYAIKLKAAEAERDLLDKTTEAYRQADAKVRAIIDAHGIAVVNAEGQKALAIKATWDTLFSAINNALQTSVNGMIQGTTTITAAWRNMYWAIYSELVAMGIKSFLAHRATELAKTGVTAQGAAARVAIETWAAIKSVALGAWSALVNIANYAAQAIAAAWASISAIPFIGPFIAPAIALATGAAVVALGSKVVSAAGGYDIPSGINPVTQLHAREMVLPAQYADMIRGMAEGGGRGGGGDTYHIHAMDASTFHAYLRKNADAVGDAVKLQVRAGRLRPEGGV